MGKHRVIREIKRTIINTETNEVISESVHKYETGYNFNPVNVMDSYIVPAVNDFILNLPTGLQKPLIEIENFLEKGVNCVKKSLAWTDEKIEQYLVKNNLINKKQQILSYKIVGALIFVIILMSSFSKDNEEVEIISEKKELVLNCNNNIENKIIEKNKIQEKLQKNKIKKEKKIKGEIRKQHNELKKILSEPVSELPKLKIKGVKSLHEIEKKVLTYNPTDLKNKFNGSYAENLENPKNANIEKFSSYEDAVIYFYHLANNYNANNEKKINVFGFMAQVAIEAGLRKKDGGYVSRLGTFGNNFTGIKTNSDVPKIYSKDDDKKNGKLVHSDFRIFNNPNEFIEHYGEFVNRDRYTGGLTVKYKGHKLNPNIKYALNNNQIYDYLHQLRLAGYCTQPVGEYEKMCTRVFNTEMKPVLQKNGLI